MAKDGLSPIFYGNPLTTPAFMTGSVIILSAKKVLIWELM
jgi:hypothetical protein